MIIAVIDGLGGGIGSHIIEKIRKNLSEDIEIIALGTNAIATSAMMKAGANKGATGKNAIIQSTKNVDIITGSLAIVLENSMMGEITPGIADVLIQNSAKKLLLPLNQNNIEVIDVPNEPLPHQVDKLIEKIKNLSGEEKNV